MSDEQTPQEEKKTEEETPVAPDGEKDQKQDDPYDSAKPVDEKLSDNALSESTEPSKAAESSESTDPSEAAGTAEVAQESQSEASSDEGAEQKSSEDPKKILESLDKEAGADFKQQEDSGAQDDSSSQEVGSPDDLPLPPGSEEEPAQDDGEESAVEQEEEKQEEAPEQELPSEHKVPSDDTIDPELMISEAMKKLDKILDEIKEEGVEDPVAANQPESPEEDSSKSEEGSETPPDK